LHIIKNITYIMQVGQILKTSYCHTA